VEISPVNTLRNFVYISTTITQSAGPSPSSISGLFGEQPSGGAVTDIKDLEGRVGQVETSLQRTSRGRFDFDPDGSSSVNFGFDFLKTEGSLSNTSFAQSPFTVTTTPKVKK